MPVGEGTNLGNAQGRISINTSDLNRVAVTSQQVGRQVEQNLGRIGIGAARAQSSFAAMSGSLNQFAGAFGISLGAAGVAQMARFVVESTKTATAFERQSVAALNLAGSQGKLNDLLRVYGTATGGAIGKAQALADVTRLQAIGFADTAAELDRFARAARGISIAMGVNQDFVISQLTLAIANQSFMRLDQIGLDAEQAKIAIDRLKASNTGLTDSMIYQQVIMEQAETKFGALADSAEGAATGVELLARAWTDLGLAMGMGSKGPVDAVAGGLAQFIAAQLRGFEEIGRLFGGGGGGVSGAAPWGTRGAPPGFTPPGPRFGENQEKAEALAIDRFEAEKDIEANATRDALEAKRNHADAVGDIERDYQTSSRREAEDFATSRLRAEADHLAQIADIREDAGRRETDAAEDLARTISRARDDSGERIAEARENANERLVELEEDFAKNRERANEDHRDKMLSAAGRLDAIALLEERKRFARESEDAKEAHDEQRDDLQEQLDERIADENEALAKSIANAQEAHDRQLEDAREADERRIQDMKDDFEARKILEDEDRAIRLTRMAEDHRARLDEMARQHQLDLDQIATNKAEERAKLQEEFDKDFQELVGRTDAQIKEHNRYIENIWANYDLLNKRLALGAAGLVGTGAIGLPGAHPSGADPYVDRPMPQGSSIWTGAGIQKMINVHANAIQINGDGLNEREVAELIVDFLEAI